jgi:5-methylthioadenosine/S-adenosylhomocysteine deaminase
MKKQLASFTRFISLACLVGSLIIAIETASATTSDVASYVLAGRIVTMDAQRRVLESGYLWVKDGVIAAVAPTREALNAALTAAAVNPREIPIIATQGDIYPGMIDLHNHPEYAIYPLLPVQRKYKDRYEWRFYDDDYQRRITHLNTLLSQAQYFDLGLELGRYGEIKALLGGTTSLQGARSAQPYAREECLVRNIETSPVTARIAFSRVDIGRDADEWRRMAEEKSKGPIAIHLAEGVGPRMANEFDFIKRSGLLGPELIAIHGVGLTEPQLKELAAAGAKLVWSPLSNFMLYGQTANIDAARSAGVLLSLAPDWSPSGSKSILGELKVADLVSRHQLKQPFTDRELVEMVTINPARAMGWEQRLGQLTTGFLADIVVIDRHQILANQPPTDPYRNLIEAVEEGVKLVVIRGQALYGDQALMRRLRQSTALETLRLQAVREKAIAPNCANASLPLMSLTEVKSRLMQALSLESEWVAQRVSLEQFSRDFLICNAGKPADPPTADNAKTLLACRFQLPFEKTTLSPLTTAMDADFFPKLLAIPHLPAYLRALPEYYGASRISAQPAASKR